MRKIRTMSAAENKPHKSKSEEKKMNDKESEVEDKTSLLKEVFEEKNWNDKLNNIFKNE